MLFQHLFNFLPEAPFTQCYFKQGLTVIAIQFPDFSVNTEAMSPTN